MKLAAIATLSVALSGCAGFNYVMEHYNHVPIRHFTASTGVQYRIFDKPEESRLMITPTLAASAAHGVAHGLTLGAVSPGVDSFREASLEYLASTDRTCATTSAEVVFKPQVEVRYQC